MSNVIEPHEKDGRRWFHVVVTVYGAWLPGDARGFRTRDHRLHVEGDYKRPPPRGKYEALAKDRRASLKQPPVNIPEPLRATIGTALRERFERRGAFVVCQSVSTRHCHLLVKLPPGRAKLHVGDAKRHAWFIARVRGWKARLWAAGCKALPVKDRRHHLNIYHYILAHAAEGAWVWKWTRPKR